jgi:hypothetical protein
MPPLRRWEESSTIFYAADRTSRWKIGLRFHWSNASFEKRNTRQVTVTGTPSTASSRTSGNNILG